MGTQLPVWFLLLASIHPPVPSVMLSLPDTHSLSPEGRLTRGWCALAFPISDWNVYTSVFCGWEMRECPNLRKRFDVNSSKSQYSTDKIETPFGPFFCNSTLNPASKTGLLTLCLGTTGVFPNSFFCHLGMFSEFPPFYFLGANDIKEIHRGIHQLWVSSVFSFHLLGQLSFSWLFLSHQLPVPFTWWFVHVEDLFLILRLFVKKSHAVFNHCSSNCVKKCWKLSGEVTPAGESISIEPWEMGHLTLTVV